MCGLHYINLGKVTQYEIEDIKHQGKGGWQYAWASVSSTFHPKSYEHFIELRNNLEHLATNDDYKENL